MTKSSKSKVVQGYKSFKTLFPIASLPLKLHPDDHRKYSKDNKPLSNEKAIDFILDENENQLNEFEEFIACFRIPQTEKIDAFVYWHGDLLNYQYFLVSFNKKGERIEKIPLSGTIVDGSMLKFSITEINNNREFIIYSGEQLASIPTLQEEKLSLSRRIQLDLISGAITAS